MEEAFIEILPELDQRYGVESVCHLKKSLYGLKQFPRAWFERVNQLIWAQSNYTTFFKHLEAKVIILIVYVDHFIITCDDYKEQEKLKGVLARAFEIKDLGPITYFPGMEVTRTKQGIAVSHRKYILDLLEETENTSWTKGQVQEETIDKGMYQQLVGRVIYIGPTRLDIAFVVNLVSYYMYNPLKNT